MAIRSEMIAGSIALFEGEVRVPDRMALHMCCAPCSQWPVEFLRAHGIEPSMLFFNPNIHPLSEWEKRKDSVLAFARNQELFVEIRGESEPETWLRRQGGKRKDCCRYCYATRLEQTAQFAQEQGLKAFGTTLLISPYQDHEAIHQIGRTLAERYNLLYCSFDFTPGFRRSQMLAKTAGYYCQKYCGCLYSLKESSYAQKLALERGVDLTEIPDCAAGRDK